MTQYAEQVLNMQNTYAFSSLFTQLHVYMVIAEHNVLRNITK